jgi:ribosomal protein S1
MDNMEKKFNFAALLKNDKYDESRPHRGEVLETEVLSVSDKDVIVALNGKHDGIITRQDLDMVDEDVLESLQVGKQIPVKVIKESPKHGGIVVSLKKGLEQQDWLRAERLLESGEVVDGEVIDVNRGGVLVNFGRLQAFVPNSHLTSIPRGLHGDRLREAKEELVGDTLSLAVIEVKQRRRRLIVSERVAEQKNRKQLLQDLAEGDIRSGVVQNVVEFGAFVDLGGIDGLIHISELDWDYVENPRAVVEEGDEIEVYVLDVDREKERIALSRKRLI